MRVGRPLAAVAVTALALAGCSSGGGTTPAQSGESTESSGSGGTQEIILLAYQSETVMQTVVDAFNESQSDVHGTVQTSEPTDGGSYAQALQTRVAGNQAPDIFNIVAENRTDVLQHDLAMDLTGMPVVDTVPGSYLDLYRKDGGVYGVTFTAWMGGLVYNKDLLSQAGFDTVPATGMLLTSKMLASTTALPHSPHIPVVKPTSTVAATPPTQSLRRHPRRSRKPRRPS